MAKKKEDTLTDPKITHHILLLEEAVSRVTNTPIHELREQTITITHSTLTLK